VGADGKYRGCFLNQHEKYILWQVAYSVLARIAGLHFFNQIQANNGQIQNFLGRVVVGADQCRLAEHWAYVKMV
jgi:hypothetical protein